MNFKAKVQQVGADVHLTFVGCLDERSELPELMSPVRGQLRIDMEQVTLINSLGCRDWIYWMKEAPVAKPVILLRCSPVVVKQINNLEGFFHDETRIASVFVPYFCENCEFEDQKLIEIDKLTPDFTEADVVSEYHCPKCGQNMELDMIQSQYFTFLKKHISKFKRP